MDDNTSLVSIGQNYQQNYLFIATKPSEMDNAQDHLVKWFEQKVKQLKHELNEVKKALDVATKSKWATSTLRSQTSRIKGTKVFYEKCLSAVRKGYYLIPNFPMETFAIRTTKKYPQGNVSKSYWNQGKQPHQSLPQGEGTYVSPDVTRELLERAKEVVSGKEEIVEYYQNVDFREVQFPLIALKPTIMNQASKAMMLKLFDEVGICPQQKAKDPIIIGKILGPKIGYTQRSMSFLISWYVDIRDL